MKRIVIFTYGLACYVVSLATLLYAIGFLGNFVVPNSIDAPPAGSALRALAIDGALLALFALQRAIMAQPWFERAWTRIVPAPVERSTYIVCSTLPVLGMFLAWHPIGGVIWQVNGGVAKAVMIGLYTAGLLLVLLSAFLMDHLELSESWQAYVTRRHYLGWMVLVWSAPLMSSAHLVFATTTTIYILAAIRFEEAAWNDYPLQEISTLSATDPYDRAMASSSQWTSPAASDAAQLGQMEPSTKWIQ